MSLPAVIMIYPAALSSFCEDGSSAEVAMCCLAAQINCPSSGSIMKGLLCDVIMVLVPGDVHITRKHMCKEWRGLVFVNFTSCPLLSDIRCPALFMQLCCCFFFSFSVFVMLRRWQQKRVSFVYWHFGLLFLLFSVVGFLLLLIALICKSETEGGLEHSRRINIIRELISTWNM